MPRIPALDGLRGVAVVWVLFFHHGFTWAQGGFLGVSVFFTLSGFLITSLLVDERSRTGGIAYRRFLARRTRRLAPAGIVAVVSTTVVWYVLRDEALPTSIGGDAAASLLKMANWWFIVDEQSYGDLFRAPSPLLHFWSLAIEEQFYLVWPPLLLLLLKLRSTAGRVAAASGLVLLSASMVLVHADFDVIYYGSHVRAAELLTGVVLALAVHSRLHGLVDGSVRAGSSLQVAGWLAVAGWFAASVWWGQDLALWRHGGLAAMGVVSAAIVAASATPGALSRLLAWRPLVAVGAWSYGLYLFHWPVFVFLTADRSGLPEAFVFPARMLVTVAVTAAVRYLVELPVQQKRVLTRGLASGLTYATGTAIGLVVALAATAAAPRGPQFTAPTGGLQVFVREPADDVAPTADPTDVPALEPESEPVTVLVVGSRPGGPFADLSTEQDDWLQVVDRRVPACPLAPVVEVERWVPITEVGGCPDSTTEWSRLAAEIAPDAVLVTIGTPDLGRFRLEPGGDLLTVRESQVHLQRAFMTAIRSLRTFDGPILIGATAGLSDEEFDRARWVLGTVTRTDPGIAEAAERLGGDLTWIRSALDDVRVPVEETGERILVLGDSTAVRFAELIFDETNGEVEAISLAQEGCPLLHADRIKWWAGTEYDLSDCPSADDIALYLERFRPSAVLIGGSLMVQAEVRFGEGPWIAPTDEAFGVLHDLYMETLQAAAAPAGSVIMVLTSPELTGAGFAGSPMARRERIDAWNAQMLRWQRSWANVRTVDWASALLAVEDERGSVRPDGVHVEDDVLRLLTRDLLLPAVDGLPDVRAELEAAGCLIGPPSARLELERCRL